LVVDVITEDVVDHHVGEFVKVVDHAPVLAQIPKKDIRNVTRLQDFVERDISDQSNFFELFLL